MEKQDKKRLTIDMSKEDHYRIKEMAARKSMSMRDWVMEALFEKLREDKDLGWE